MTDLLTYLERHSAEVEITPEMMSAGMTALADHEAYGLSNFSVVVRDIFSAMTLAKLNGSDLIDEAVRENR